MKLEFKETQKLSQWWLWLILLTSAGFMIFKTYQHLFLEVQDGNIPISIEALVVLTILLIGLIVIFGMMKLKTELNQQELKISFIPFSKKHFYWKDIKSAKVIDYGFVGGWGLRFWTAHGTVYNTGGNIGLALEFKNGDKFLVGTQKGEELKEFLKDLDLENK